MLRLGRGSVSWATVSFMLFEFFFWYGGVWKLNDLPLFFWRWSVVELFTFLIVLSSFYAAYIFLRNFLLNILQFMKGE